jgi:purine nucleosidase
VAPLKIVVDTDAGVDDAVAITWLLAQREYEVDIAGISCVAGNATVENVANNVLTVLDVAGRRDIDVVIGADRPLAQPHCRVGEIMHGPDGLWRACQTSRQDVSTLGREAAALYSGATAGAAGAILLALGPLTNLAVAEDKSPGILSSFSRVISLGGLKLGKGTRTPVSTFNFWEDAEAAKRVLSLGLDLTLVLHDAHTNLRFVMSDLEEIQGSSSPYDFLLRPMQKYAQIQEWFYGAGSFGLPDLAAAMYATDESLGHCSSALVEVVAGDGPARGLSVIGITPPERLSMTMSVDEANEVAQQATTLGNQGISALLGAMDGYGSGNARVVLDVEADRMRQLFFATAE